MSEWKALQKRDELIWALRDSGCLIKQIAEKVGVSPGLVSRICRLRDHRSARYDRWKKGSVSGNTIVSGPYSIDGRETWNLTIDGEPLTLTTSASSVAAMDRAVVVYSGALKRLADR